MKNQFLLLSFSILVLSSCMSTNSSSTNFTPNPHVETYEDLEHDKDELYILANEWFNQAFVNAESVISFRDKESGVIIGKYRFFGTRYTTQYGTSDNTVMASIVIRLKDNKARVTITPLGEIRYSNMSYDGISSGNKYSEEDAKRDMSNLANDFNHFVMSANNDF
ncbi:hypothetical protein DN752_17805 [Echinicola strongylocentroti]|uniref:DUF4468 domain-containing protein n=1 Tax=Echinicola strongylocentroti TaxID=1795355 RepID=A0A2Z4IML3_9BACT|nr:DUF4468 domain-containing protein [Echinicola strongylocentroti]AWW31836.1 hypothetical protein DN752_17805 [Echinicola strongylocentroti]